MWLHVTEIRLAGLVPLRDVIEVRTLLWYFLSSSRISIDICYISWPRLRRCASLRTASRTYYCGNTAALTPAFSSNLTPEFLAAGWGRCGVVKDIGRMGRIRKLITTALEKLKGLALSSSLRRIAKKSMNKIRKLSQLPTAKNQLELHFSSLSLVLFMKLLPLLPQMHDMPLQKVEQVSFPHLLLSNS